MKKVISRNSLINSYKKMKSDKKIVIERYYDSREFISTFGEVKKIIIDDLKFYYYVESSNDTFIVFPAKYSSERRISKKIKNIYSINIELGDAIIDDKSYLGCIKIMISNRYPIPEDDFTDIESDIRNIYNNIDFIINNYMIYEKIEKYNFYKASD